MAQPDDSNILDTAVPPAVGTAAAGQSIAAKIAAARAEQETLERAVADARRQSSQGQSSSGQPLPQLAGPPRTALLYRDDFGGTFNDPARVQSPIPSTGAPANWTPQQAPSAAPGALSYGAGGTAPNPSSLGMGLPVQPGGAPSQDARPTPPAAAASPGGALTAQPSQPSQPTPSSGAIQPGSQAPGMIPAPDPGFGQRGAPPHATAAQAERAANPGAVSPAHVGINTEGQPRGYMLPVNPMLAADIPKRLGQDLTNTVVQAATKFGVDPNLAMGVIYNESRGNPDVPNSSAGAVGIMQMLPSTLTGVEHWLTKEARMNNPNAPEVHLDLKDPRQAIIAGTAYLGMLTSEFGGNHNLATIAYNWGPGNTELWLRNGADPSKLPNETKQYFANIFGDGKTDVSQLLKPSDYANVGATSNYHPQDIQDILMHAGPQAPEQLHDYMMSKAGPAGNSQAWDNLRQSLIETYMRMGDVQGAQQASNMIDQQMFRGTNRYLQSAYAAMQSGNPTAAAQMLAQAHAFFPDGRESHYGVDAQGNVIASMHDEMTGKPIGSPFVVTKEGIINQLQANQDPQSFIGNVMKEKAQAIADRAELAREEYYRGKIAETQAGVEERATAAHEHSEDRQAAIKERADKAQQDAADREVGLIKSLPGGPEALAAQLGIQQPGQGGQLLGRDGKPMTSEQYATATGNKDNVTALEGYQTKDGKPLDADQMTDAAQAASELRHAIPDMVPQRAAQLAGSLASGDAKVEKAGENYFAVNGNKRQLLPKALGQRFYQPPTTAAPKLLPPPASASGSNWRGVVPPMTSSP